MACGSTMNMRDLEFRSMIKFLRKEGTWRIRTNQEIYDLYKDNNIVIDIKVRCIEWLGHICRMNDARLSRMILTK